MNKIHKLSFKKLKKKIKSKHDIKKTVKYFNKRILRKNSKLLFSNLIVKPNFSKNISYNRKKISFITYTIKDIFLVKNTISVANNRNLKFYKNTFDCTVYKILKENKSIFLGKTNLDEFAIGSYGINTNYITLNPWNKNIFPGGSSSGSAVSVASGACMFSIATDTGGSVRIPSSINGLTGMKPTYGTISRYGVVSFAPTLDTVGVISKNAEDIIKILKKIQKKDFKDKTSVKFVNKKCKKNIIIPIKVFNSKYLDKETKYYLQKFISFCEKDFILKYDKKISEDFLVKTNEIYYSISSVEAYSCLSKFDNIRYGRKKNIFKSIKNIYKNFSIRESVKKRMKKGKKVLSNENEYKYNNILRKMIKKNMNIYLKNNYIILPVISLKEIEKKTKNVDMYNTIANITGFPSVSFRIGFSKKYNIPICIQILGKKFEDINILKIVKNFQ
ncbi:amidase family protein [Candidatus Vidania fulgoroideorum]